ncbi:MAG: AAA family ATPase [Candidatus Firestonebacteria bacterium RIFOXYA2_FULL_40_8]|nr:MAG: AAA family ATPase [Candidatus Firestonebacteria bacterium RIFOXYA2_FULL_40_8]
MYKRAVIKEIIKRVNEKRHFIQVLSGPRQTGKTTLAKQISESIGFSSIYITADAQGVSDNSWLIQQWEIVRANLNSKEKKVLLIIDEIQKIENWSETVKKMWDEDTVKSRDIRVMLLGSSRLLLHKGLTESLAGRFETIPVFHWSYGEMKEAFGFGLSEYIFFGGYPGGADLIKDEERWSHYVRESLIETTVAKDILMLERVNKPALLKRLFELGCLYSGQALSYQKMLGQLQDAGNTTTLAHYLDLLESAGLLMGVQKYAGEKVRQRGSTPKLQALNTGLIGAMQKKSFKEVIQDSELWGHFVESSVGASLSNGIKGKNIELFYWASSHVEVDFVLAGKSKIVAIEVKSGRKRTALPGLEQFNKAFKPSKLLVVGTGGITIEQFLMTPPEKWLK